MIYFYAYLESTYGNASIVSVVYAFFILTRDILESKILK
jgi:hypothetical protein